MKSYRKVLTVNIPSRRGFLNITPQVAQAVRESGVQEGLALVNAMNITASVFINDDESGLHSDYERWLEKLAPEKPYSQYAHNGYEDNADAHLKRTIMGREVVVAITEGKLDFGTWEQIFYGEFDGMRQKRIMIKIIGDVSPTHRCPSRSPMSAPLTDVRPAHRSAEARRALLRAGAPPSATQTALSLCTKGRFFVEFLRV